MSYDVKLFRILPGAGTPAEQVDRGMSAAYADGSSPPLPLTAEDVQRIETALADVRSLDPEAEIEEMREGGQLNGFTVVDSAALPYMEIGAHNGALAWSMSAEPGELYRSLQQMTAFAARHGFAAFDHQQGAMLTPSDNFSEFMQQFMDQWPSPESFRQWLAQETGTPMPAAAPAARWMTSTNLIGLATLVLVLIWGAYKLHKAGYFQAATSGAGDQSIQNRNAG